MPLMILRAEELVGGEEIFDKILQGIQKNNEDFGWHNPFTFMNFLEACGLQKEDLKL
jgi:hypothetical protein